MKTFHLSILTPDRVVLDDDVDYISVPGETGYMGILADHEPLIGHLKPGNFEVRTNNGTRAFRTEYPGLLEVFNCRVSILLNAQDNPIPDLGKNS